MAEFDPPSPNLGMGSNDLQTRLDALTAAITTLNGTIQGMSTPGGLTSLGSPSSAAPNARFTAGSMAGPNGGGAGFSGANGGGMNSGAAGGNGAPGGLAGALMGNVTVGGAISGAANAALATGASQYGTQVMMNNFSNSMSSLYGGSAQNWQYSTFGDYNKTQNANALSAQDAAQGAAINAYTARGPNVAAASNLFAYANPGLGSAQSAAISNALYNNKTAMNLRLYAGVNVYSANGQANTATNVLQQLGQRYGGALGYDSKTGQFNINTLRNQLNTQQSAFGQGISQMTGMSQSQLYDIVSAQSNVQKVENNAHVSAATVNGYVQQASKGDRNAQNWLTGHGWINTTQQALQDANSSKLAQQSGESQAFNSALQTSAGLLTNFNNVMSDLLNGPLGQAVGYKNGLAGGANLWASQNPGTSSLLGSLTGNVLGTMFGGQLSRALTPVLSRLPGIGRLLGGGGAGAAGAGAADAAAAEGGTAAAAAGGASMLSVLPAAGVALGLSQIHNKNGTNWLQQGPGGSGTWWNNWDVLGHDIKGWFATGGVVPGYTPGVDGHTVRVSGGEGILTPEATMGIGGSTTINALNRKYAGYRGGGFSSSRTHFADGGVTSADDNLGLITDADSMLFSNMGGGAGGLAGVTPQSSSSSSSGGSGGSSGGGYGPAVNVTSGGGLANGRTIYNYLLRNLFGGNKIAAAGAIASIWGESSWNPEASEGSWPGAGQGLIQWTGSNLTKAMGWTPMTGNASRDMSAQLPGIIAYVHGHGAMGTISEMMRSKTVAAAAQLWDHGVEGAGINDVHPTGIMEAGQIAGLSRSMVGLAGGGTFVAGERGPEAVTISNGQSANVMTASQTASLLRGTSAMAAQGPWTSSPTAMYVLDALSPANAAHTAGRGGVTVNLGGITIHGAGSPQSSGTGTGSDINVMEQQFEQAVTKAIQKSGMLDAIRQGNTG